ncbi:hypothetical protein D3C72_2343270 [compost metagenome]
MFLWGDSGATRFERRFGIDKRDCQRAVAEFAGRVADCHIGVGKTQPVPIGFKYFADADHAKGRAFRRS